MENREIEILLVEDSIDDAELTIRALRNNNVTTNIVHLMDGAAALDFLFGTGKYTGRNIENRPKVILLDLKMPKMGGMEVLEKLKADPEFRSIPIVILTSSKEDPDIQKCYALGANSYIAKPVESDNFFQVIKEIGMYWMVLSQLPD